LLTANIVTSKNVDKKGDPDLYSQRFSIDLRTVLAQACRIRCCSEDRPTLIPDTGDSPNEKEFVAQLTTYPGCAFGLRTWLREGRRRSHEKGNGEQQ
jgi:hypothetical protein